MSGIKLDLELEMWRFGRGLSQVLEILTRRNGTMGRMIAGPSAGVKIPSVPVCCGCENCPLVLMENKWNILILLFSFDHDNLRSTQWNMHPLQMFFHL